MELFILLAQGRYGVLQGLVKIYLVAGWIHFTLFDRILPTIKQSVHF